jgi:hypothetical protein
MTQEVERQDHPDFIGGLVWTKLESRWIEERIAEAILAERESCAKVADGFIGGDVIAERIRARGRA